MHKGLLLRSRCVIDKREFFKLGEFNVLTSLKTKRPGVRLRQLTPQHAAALLAQEDVPQKIKESLREHPLVERPLQRFAIWSGKDLIGVATLGFCTGTQAKIEYWAKTSHIKQGAYAAEALARYARRFELHAGVKVDRNAVHHAPLINAGFELKGPLYYELPAA